MRLPGMNFTPVRLLPAAALAAAALIPASASAASTVGSAFDTSQGDATTVSCTNCTFAMDSAQYLLIWTDPGVITSVRAQLAAGTTAKLRVFNRVGDQLVAAGASQTITGTGQDASYLVKVPVASNATIGLDLNGSITAVKDPGEIIKANGLTPDGAAIAGTRIGVEPLLSANVESDYDEDGLGDETQDDCVFCPPPADNGGSNNGGSDNGGQVTPPPPSGTDDQGSKDSQDSGDPRDVENIRSQTVFTIQNSGLVTAGKKAVARVWLFNPHNDSYSGTATLKVAGKKVASTRVLVLSHDAVDFKLTPKAATALRKGARATVSATVADADGGKESAAGEVAFAKPVTSAYDGTYRGKGPIVFKVQGGVVTVASQSLFLAS